MTAVIVAGSRHITDYGIVSAAIEESPWEPSVILTGDASGVDTLAQQWARHHSVPVQVFKARWWEHGPAAGPIRNREMARIGEALVLVWDGHSKGSRSMRNEAYAAGVPIHERIVGDKKQRGLGEFAR